MEDVNINSNKILLLGLPDAGKTSFLAAFSFYLETDFAGKELREYQLSSNTTYITSIRQKWLRGERQERTKVTATVNPNTEVDMFIENSRGTRFILHVPDFFGETFENQFIDRQIELGYLNQLAAAAGILLFINPEKIKAPILIEDMIVAHQVEDEINLEETYSQTSDFTKAEIIDAIAISAPFRAEDSPTQVVLVDLIESHLEFCPTNRFRLSVIVSAWDTIKVDNNEISPARWLEVTLPLLSQYLTTNFDRLEVRIFGISAQGGDFEQKAQFEFLTGLNNPIDRIIVQEGDREHKNISAPIDWILG